MAKTEIYPIKRMMTDDDLNRLIRSLERSARVLKKLLFIRYRYSGDSVEEAAKKIGVTKMMGYIWQKRWNKDGYRGIIPRYARKGPSKMSLEQKESLMGILSEGQFTTAQVREIIREKFNVEYTMKQVWVILRKMNMRYAKPYAHDKRRPADAEEKLKKT